MVTIACDMPFLTAPLLAWLARLEGPAIVHGAGRPQPLIARHTPAGAAILARALQERRSLTDGCLLAGCRVVGEQELSRHGDPGRLCFSVNSPADVALAESWLAGSPVSAPGG